MRSLSSKTGFYSVSEGTVTFRCPENAIPLHGGTEPVRVGVRGTFTAWRKQERFMLRKAGGAWSLRVPAEATAVPGNSGFPEFVCFAEFADGTGIQLPCAEEDGFHFQGNTVLFQDGEGNASAVAQNERRAGEVRPLGSFDLSRDPDRHTLANMRLVPGTTCLWRGYHPYKKSRPLLDTEDARLSMVNELLEEHGIRSVITLSGDEECDAALGERILPYMAGIRASWNQMTAQTSYETVYFGSAGDEFGRLIAAVVRFMNTHPAPYYVHCRLGSDRTGTVSAVLAALSGARWDDIAADYERTSLMGIQEFRDRRLLAHCLNAMAQDGPAEKTLGAALSGHLVRHGYLSQDELSRLVRTLTQRESGAGYDNLYP